MLQVRLRCAYMNKERQVQISEKQSIKAQEAALQQAQPRQHAALRRCTTILCCLAPLAQHTPTTTDGCAVRILLCALQAMDNEMEARRIRANQAEEAKSAGRREANINARRVLEDQVWPRHSLL